MQSPLARELLRYAESCKRALEDTPARNHKRGSRFLSAAALAAAALRTAADSDLRDDEQRRGQALLIASTLVGEAAATLRRETTDPSLTRCAEELERARLLCDSSLARRGGRA